MAEQIYKDIQTVRNTLHLLIQALQSEVKADAQTQINAIKTLVDAMKVSIDAATDHLLHNLS